jgi:hypothetical protein
MSSFDKNVIHSPAEIHVDFIFSTSTVVFSSRNLNFTGLSWTLNTH